MFGQTTLLTEGWESATNNSNVPPTGWGIDLLGYTNITYYMSAGTYPAVAPFEGSRLVDFESYNYGTGTTNRLKRTTAISTVGYSSVSVDFEWYTDSGYAGTTTEGVIVQWSTDGSTWTSAGTTWMRYAATNQWVLNTQVLPAGAAGQATLYIAFLFNSNFGDDCHMDIIHVKGTAAATALLGQGWEATTNNTNVPPTGWVIDNLGYTNITYFMSAGTYPAVAPYEGSRLVDFESYSYGTNTTNRLRMSTPISTVGYTSLTVDFAWYVDPGYAGTTTEGVIIQWSTDGATWTSAGTTWMRYAATAGWIINVQNLPVGAENNPALYIGFLFNSNFGNDCHMDIIHVNGVGSVILPTVTTTAATAITGSTSTLNGTVNANGVSTAVTFQYGLTVAYGTTVPGVPTPVTGSTATAVSAAITGLTPNTLYHYRCIGTGTGTTNGNDMTFTTLAVPVVVTTAASGVLSFTANVNGTVNASGVSTTTSFDYGLTVAYGTNVPGVPLTVTGSVVTAVTAALAGLLPGNTYHYRINGVNANGTSNGNDMTFVTPTAAPTVVTLAANNITGTTATLNGTINANGASTTVSFDYGLTIAYGSTIAGTPTPVTGNSVTAVLANIIALTPNQTYHFRVKGVNAVGTTNGTDLTFVSVCNAAGAAGTITGPTSVCDGGTGYVYTVPAIPNATGYIWTVPVGGTIISGNNTNSITVSYSPTAVSGYVFVYGTSICGNGSPSQLAVTVNVPAAPTLIGPVSPCITSTGNVYTTQAGKSNYVWTVSAGGTPTAGGTATSNTITVTWITAGAQTVSVNYNSSAGCPALAPTVYNVTVNPLPVPIVTGPTPSCTNIPGITYSTQAGMTNYVWTISAGGTITAGATTNTITVIWNTAGAQNVSVTYTNPNGCTAAAPTVYPVTVNPTTVPVITGTSSLCVNTGYYNYTTQTGMINYIWTVSSGGTITNGQGTSTLQVMWTGTGAQTVSVIFTNGSNFCTASNPTVLPVTVNGMPDAAGSITGTASVCAGAAGIAYSVPAINNAITYVWTLPAGATIASGSGTNSITVDYANNASAGNITVYGNSICGNGATSPPYPVSVTQIPATAGVITGQPAVCEGATGLVYSVDPIANATAYNWTVPSGVSIIAGPNTNSITVDFGPAAVSGNFSVAGTNSCGDGTASPNYAVSVNPIPVAPVIQITITGDLSSDAPLGNQWYLDGTLIPGATAQTLTPSQTGHYTDIVTLNVCSSALSNDIYFVMTGIGGSGNSSSVSVYPNPGDGLFNVIISVKEPQSFNLNVINNLGVTIYEEKDMKIKDTHKMTLDLRSYPEGDYTLLLKNNRNQITRKLVLNK